jgi:ribosomal protein L37E
MKKYIQEDKEKELFEFIKWHNKKAITCEECIITSKKWSEINNENCAKCGLPTAILRKELK